MASGQYWIIWSTRAGKLAGRIEQAASAPALPSGADSVEGPFTTKAEASAELARISGQSAAAPSGPLGAVGTGLSAVNPLSGFAAIGDFFGKLGQANTWIRVAEVLLGLALIAVGVAKLTNAVPIATSIAKVAA